jgi:hypothetical protein
VHRVTQADITAAFADGWQVDSIEPATIEITLDRDGIRAWFAALTCSKSSMPNTSVRSGSVGVTAFFGPHRTP